jgi:hypothetical protein
MIKKILVMIIACFSVVSCASVDPGYKIVQDLFETNVVAAYESYEFLKAKEEKKAEAEMREPKYDYIPKFGCITIDIRERNPELANPKNWLFVVKDGNKKTIYVRNGTGSARIPLTSSQMWTSFHIISFSKEIVFPLYLTVEYSNYRTVNITIIKK